MNGLNAEHSGRGRGFALVELVVVGVLVLAAASVFVGATRKQRRSSQQTESVSNLRQIGAMTHAYVADSADGLPSFTWRALVRYGQYIASNDVDAAANQATDILRRRFDPAFPAPPQWVPQIDYSHLALADHAGLALPNSVFVSPADTLAVRLSRNPADLSMFPAGSQFRRTVARGSYRTATAVFAGRETADGGSLRQAGGQHNLFQFSGGSANQFPLLPKQLSAFAFPSQKAYMFDEFDWFSRSGPVHFGIGAARCGVLMFDGSASTRDLSGANDGAYTGFSNSFTYTRAPLTYLSSPADLLSPAAPSGTPTTGSARLRFTFRQQLGRDFGPQVP